MRLRSLNTRRVLRDPMLAAGLSSILLAFAASAAEAALQIEGQVRRAAAQSRTRP